VLHRVVRAGSLTANARRLASNDRVMSLPLLQEVGRTASALLGAVDEDPSMSAVADGPV
jgi:hypothetical protein